MLFMGLSHATCKYVFTLLNSHFYFIGLNSMINSVSIKWGANKNVVKIKPWSDLNWPTSKPWKWFHILFLWIIFYNIDYIQKYYCNLTIQIDKLMLTTFWNYIIFQNCVYPCYKSLCWFIFHFIFPMHHPS